MYFVKTNLNDELIFCICSYYYYICTVINIRKMSYKSVKDVVTMLQKNGFVLKSQKGSHMKFEKDGKVVVVPNHNSKGVEKGTYYSILRQAGLK